MTYTRPEFVEKYGGFIANAVKGTGLLSGTVIAQAMIESQSDPPPSASSVGSSKLARNSNNYFGIKCHGWKGKSYNINTGEEHPDGTPYTDFNACFRAYDSVEDSIVDYVKFLKENPRYEKAGVFRAKTVKEQAQALKNAGYATGAGYADLINKVYLGVKNYVDKYSEYGISGIAKSFANNPVSFVKRNWIPVAISVVLLTGVGIGIYQVVKNRK